jgi:hypothetical protein
MPEEAGATAQDPGERVLRLSTNTAVFAGLVVVGLLFVAYAFGVQAGRRGVAGAVGPAPEFRPAAPAAVVPAPAPAPVPAARTYTLRLAEWKYETARERLNAAAAAEDLKKALDRGGFRGAEKVEILRGGERRLALYLDRVKDVNAEPARARLQAIQKFRVGGQTPFQQAKFEELPQ